MKAESEVMEKKQAGAGLRSKAPVFVLGCGRSGTKLLYHTLLSGLSLIHI